LKENEGANAYYVVAEVHTTSFTSTPILLDQQSIISPEPESTSEQIEKVQLLDYSLLQQDDNYPAVETLQRRLMELGYLDSDEPNTYFGAATTAAVSLVQRTMSAKSDGVATSDLQEYLYSNAAAPYEVRLGDFGDDVESMQGRLTELGYYEDKINGYFGVATESALSSFEKKTELGIDGVFSISDRNLLYSPSAKPKIDPTPTPSPVPTSTPKKTTPKPTAKPGGGSTASTPSGSGSVNSTPNTNTGGSYNASYSVEGLISVATAMKGVKYSWSQQTPEKGFDCSGLVYFCLRTCGVSTSRYSSSGFSQVSRWGYIDSIAGLNRGDLVFFRDDSSSNVSHTGIYLGSGSFIHASSSAGSVIVSSINTAYWTRNFICGRRVF